jgi:hypothetical protein
MAASRAASLAATCRLAETRESGVALTLAETRPRRRIEM